MTATSGSARWPAAIGFAVTALLALTVGMPGVARASVPKPTCQPGDAPETALQGQVPLVDRASGRAVAGYRCNLVELGGYGAPINPAHDRVAAWATLDTYKNCAYYADTVGVAPIPGQPAGVVVVDISDARHPKRTDYLTTMAMQNPWESLRVNAKRGLLVADRPASHYFDVYDVATDCRHPRLLFSGPLPNAQGHEGWFQPDGLVYYISNSAGPNDPFGKGVWPIDLADPRHPKEHPIWLFAGQIHGGSVSADGRRGYFCQLGNPDGVITVDTSGVQERRDFRKPRVLSSLAIPFNIACQATYPVHYGTHPYVIQYGEEASRCNPRTASMGAPNFDHPRIIDIANARAPKIVSNLRLEVDEPRNCTAVSGDVSPRSVSFAPGVGGGGPLFGYSVHHCSPDRLLNPTILACGQFDAGLRVYDIRDPKAPKELAYLNLGTLSIADSTIDSAISRPVVLTERKLVVFTSEFSGLHVAGFESGVWPFAGDACPGGSDYYFAHYNPGSRCTPASRHPVVTPDGTDGGAAAGPTGSNGGGLGATGSSPTLALAALGLAAAVLLLRRRLRVGRTEAGG
jgi:hypothetical protein